MSLLFISALAWKAALTIALMLGIAAIRTLINMFLPPAHLRHLPKIPTFAFMFSIIRSEGNDSREKRILLPILDKKGMATIWFNGTWSVLLSDPAYVKTFMTNADTIPKDIRLLKQNKLKCKMFGLDNLGIKNKEEWRYHRKFLNPAFRHTFPTQMFGECTHELFEILDQAILCELPVEIPPLMSRLSLDALGKYIFKFNFNALKGAGDEYCQKYNAMMKGMFNPLFIFFPKISFLPLPVVRRLSKTIDDVNELLFGIIERKKKELDAGLYKDADEHEKDVLTYMIEGLATEDESKWSKEQIRADLLILFGAGHESTQGSLSLVLYFLAVHPEYQELARQEADSILSEFDRMHIPNVEQCRHMKYIDCIIKESLRLHPPASLIGPRVLETPMKIGDETFPQGTYLLANLFALQNSSRTWKDPERFWPERFLPENNPPRDAWMPFSGGPRICLGMQFSLTEQRVVVSMLLRNYTWSLPADSPHANGLKTNPIFGPVHLQNLKLNFKRRN
ncbi:uncharacterized protein VTP21DRAFT_673 [Calcarisporiella thermophila]|uniref:uncharacterized protein n=1 Tax=Calcarisporiella thermophila TaxID=911321 RepID=UPI0037446886